MVTCLVPDLLHQLYQGLIKTHAMFWSKKTVGIKRLDNCFAAMPGTWGMRYFSKGISKVGQWTGRESKEMAKQLLPAVAGQTTPEMTALIRSVVDFTFRAHQSRMTDEINSTEGALASMHQWRGALVPKVHKSRARLDLSPKIHMISHYSESIRSLGTPDGYSTESPEFLHIVYAKRGWRASNKVRPLPQMILFVQRLEALRIHRALIDAYYGVSRDKKAEGSWVVYGEDEDALEDEWEDMESGGDGDGDGESDVDEGGIIAPGRERVK